MAVPAGGAVGSSTEGIPGARAAKKAVLTTMGFMLEGGDLCYKTSPRRKGGREGETLMRRGKRNLEVEPALLRACGMVVLGGVKDEKERQRKDFRVIREKKGRGKAWTQSHQPKQR